MGQGLASKMTPFHLACDTSFPLTCDLSNDFWDNPDRHDAAKLVPIVRAEMAEELDKRVRLYPSQVKRGGLDPIIADRRCAVLRAIDADFAWRERWSASWTRGSIEQAPSDSWHWVDKVQELRREIDLRRRFYPQWTDPTKAMLTPAQAAHKLGVMEWVYQEYWLGLWRYFPTMGSTYPTRAELDEVANIQRARALSHDNLDQTSQTNQEQLALLTG